MKFLSRLISSMFLAASFFFLVSNKVSAASCGAFYSVNNDTCQCVHSESSSQTGTACCGWLQNPGPNESCSPTTTAACGTGVPNTTQYNSVVCPGSCPNSGTYTSGGNTLRCCGYIYNGTCNATKQTVACGTSFDLADTSKACSSACGHEEDFRDPNGSFMHCCGWSFDGVCGQKQTLACGQSYENDRTDVQCDSTCPSAQFQDSSAGGIAKVCCGYVTANNTCSPTHVQNFATCGTTYSTANKANYTCNCFGVLAFDMPSGQTCCGYRGANGSTSSCFPTAQSSGNAGTGSGNGSGLSSSTFDTFNTAIFGGTPDQALTTPRGIIGKLLPYLFTIAGLILFVMLIWGGFEMLTGAANPKSQEAGKQRMTSAIIGFILLFASYWLAQIVQAIFGISIL